MTYKRANGTGSVYKLSGRRRHPYVAIITSGWELNDDKSTQKRRILGTFRTRNEALIALADYNKATLSNEQNQKETKMSRSDIFIMMYFCLAAYLDTNKTDSLEALCNGLNPFLFRGIGLTAQSYWTNFCKEYSDKQYTTLEGYYIAKEHVRTLENAEATKAMDHISFKQWEESYIFCKEDQ